MGLMQVQMLQVHWSGSWGSERSMMGGGDGLEGSLVDGAGFAGG